MCRNERTENQKKAHIFLNLILIKAAKNIKNKIDRLKAYSNRRIEVHTSPIYNLIDTYQSL